MIVGILHIAVCLFVIRAFHTAITEKERQMQGTLLLAVCIWNWVNTFILAVGIEFLLFIVACFILTVNWIIIILKPKSKKDPDVLDNLDNL